ncbi:MAG: HD domain-containing protein [Candidatus Paceibacterota bacterium]|jgi:poly(A) polymerase/tRNA nucleotidyltransferase (CCA-adding enzyme)
MKQQEQKLINSVQIPEYVTHVTQTLEKAGFEAFLVGGCVRDLIMGREPKDWDITTNAKPEEILPLFEKTIYENNFGTVGVCTPSPEPGSGLGVTHETKYHIVEVTPYRIEAKYSDFRHPDAVKFSNNIEDDLKRRDFTMNALAFSPDGIIKDNFDGLKDIKDKVIRTVGKPADRFNEDALRMLRAVRFSVQLDFTISHETMEAILKNSHLLKEISFERTRDEFTKIIESSNSARGIGLLQKLGLLKYIIPELEEGIGCEQGGAHIYDVFEHLLGALGHATDKGWSLEVRLSALFHDIGKPRSRRPGIKKAYTFYGHEVIGARMAKQIMERLKFPQKTTDLVIKLVRGHMFFSDTETITLSAVRRVVVNVGKEHIWDLMNVRECDRVGMKKKEAPYRLRKYHAMIEEVLHDPISVGQLAINGEMLINELHMKPGPRMGWILSALLEEVLDDPTKNKKEHLIELVKSLDMLGDDELKTLGERGKVKKEELEKEEVEKLHKKHGV